LCSLEEGYIDSIEIIIAIKQVRDTQVRINAASKWIDGLDKLF
jgi:hypothetical protein